jgi:hypothetical protein
VRPIGPDPRRVARWFVSKTKNPNLGKFWWALDWKTLLCYLAICNILRTFGIFYDHLVHFVLIWCIFPGFGITYQEKSGNPGPDPWLWEADFQTTRVFQSPLYFYSTYQRTYLHIVCGILWILWLIPIMMVVNSYKTNNTPLRYTQMHATHSVANNSNSINNSSNFIGICIISNTYN